MGWGSLFLILSIVGTQHVYYYEGKVSFRQPFLAGVTEGTSGPWDALNYAPSSRTVFPVAVHSVVGTVTGASNLVNSSNGEATFSGNGSYVALDFGKEVGGVISFNVDQASTSSAFSLSFTESASFISTITSDTSCSPIFTMNEDGVLSQPAPLTLGTFTQPLALQRGGFRFLTIVSNSNTPFTISNVTLSLTFMPQLEDLTAYTGYFFTTDPVFHDPEFLTKLWYAGAYTVQMNTISVDQSHPRPCPAHGWANNATGGPVQGTILVDGAKRDRNVWPGDMGISTHTEFVSTNDLASSKNSLAVMFSTQDPVTGALNYSGPPISAQGSDTYIAWSLIGTYSYYLYTGDLDFVQTVWSNYTKALAFLESQVDHTALINVPEAFSNDWGREGGTGHNSAANAVLYRSLIVASQLATLLGDAGLAGAYSANATTLKAAFNRELWDSSAGMYRDNETTSLHPQDGNSLAVLFNLTTSASQRVSISEGLTKFWTDIGSLSPELNDTIIPFVGGFEVQAHFIAGQGELALDFLRKQWGYMLYTNLSVQSTLLEGFTKNGSLGYRSSAGYDFDHSFTSHAHGWSTGPTSALTFFVLGLQLTSAQGATWSISPMLSGLNAAEGGFETGLGWFGVKWSITGGKLTILIETPTGTKGSVSLPGTGETVQVDGNTEHFGSSGKVVQLGGGNHTLVQTL